MEQGQSNITPGTFNGTLGGTLLIIIVNIKTAELIKTAVLAAIGAVISFYHYA